MKTRIFASFGLWVAAVASVAGIAWLAIGTAGRQVTAVTLSAPLATEFSASPTGSAAPGATAEGGKSGPKRTTDRTAPTQRPTRTPSHRDQDGGGSPTDSFTGWSGSPGPTMVPGLYSTFSGRIKVNCQGSKITLAGGYAQPASNWSVRVQSSGPQRVQVLFEKRNRQALLVVAVCQAGRPQFDQHRIEDDGQHANDGQVGGQNGWHD